MYRTLFRAAIVCGLFLVLPQVHGAVINVPGNQPTIQAAINAAVSGVDEVVVAPGTYTETINFNGKAITVRSSGAPEDTTIDGNLTGSVVTCTSSEGAATVLDGFTIKRGSAPSDGGGMIVVYSSPTIRNCIFEQNQADSGGAIKFDHSASLVEGCLFIENEATLPGNGWGGGILLVYSQLTVKGCTFIGNYATGSGGAVSNSSQSHVSLVDCTFVDNSAIWAGALWSGHSPADVVNCRFVGNRTNGSSGYGGAITVAWSESDVSMVNCLLAGNTSNNGGSISLSASCDVSLTNCVVAHNQAGTGGGIYNQLWSGSSLCTVKNSIVWANASEQIRTDSGCTTTVAYTCIQGGYSGSGNSPANPQFVGGPSGSWTAHGSYEPSTGQTTLTDASAAWEPNSLIGDVVNPATFQYRSSLVVANTQSTITVLGDFSLLGLASRTYRIDDYQISDLSPGIDTAHNAYLPPDTFDLDDDGDTAEPVPFDLAGDERIVNGTVDMGAYEFGGGCSSTAICPNTDANCDNVTNGLDIAEISSSANFGLPTHLAANPLTDVNADGQVNGLDVAAASSSACFGQ